MINSYGFPDHLRITGYHGTEIILVLKSLNNTERTNDTVVSLTLRKQYMNLHVYIEN
jgi:hypothetical protein